MSTIKRPIQVRATQPVQSKPVDSKLLTYVKNKNAKGGGWSVADTNNLVKHGVLNDAPPAKYQPNGRDEYANVSEGNIIRPMLAKANDQRIKVTLDGQRFQFTSSKSAKHFVSAMGSWFAKNA